MYHSRAEESPPVVLAEDEALVGVVDADFVGEVGALALALAVAHKVGAGGKA